MICGTAKKPLARKYARAFLRIFSELNQQSFFQSIDRLLQCCSAQPLVFHTLLLSSARIQDKCKGLKALTEKLQIIEPLERLLETLLRQKNLDILPSLLPILKSEYKKSRNCQDVVITSAQPLTEKEKKRLELVLSTKLNGTLTFIYQHDASLVAGVRVQTPTHYWEHSVAKVVRTLEHRLAMQELA